MVYHEKKGNAFGRSKKVNKRRKIRKKRFLKKRRKLLISQTIVDLGFKESLLLGIFHNMKRQTDFGPLA